MKKKEFLIIPLFEKFIRDTKSGKRLKPNGERIKLSSIKLYEYVFIHLVHIESIQKNPLRISIVSGINRRELLKEAKYWKKFYLQLTSYLYNERKCFDNYVNTVIKTLKAFYNYLKKEQLIPVPDYVFNVYIKKNEPTVLALTTEQLKYLIYNKEFEDLLNKNEKIIKDIFVFGCTVALRQSDVFAIKNSNLEYVNELMYLKVISKKTATPTRVKLPAYAKAILDKYRSEKNKYIFPQMSLNWFNVNLKRIALKANWTNEFIIHKTQQGILKKNTTQAFRLCDKISSHFMRRTAITTMITLGMPEHVVRQVSGHAPTSKEFYRYVQYAQSFLDDEINKVHTLMAS